MLYIPTIPMPDLTAQAAARDRQQILAKPAGGLGILEGLSVRLAAMRGTVDLSFPRKSVIIMAGDHRNHPNASQIETQRIANRQAAVAALARQVGATITLVDIGLTTELPKDAQIGRYNVAKGTRPMTDGPALTLPEATDALMVGMNVASLEISQGVDLLTLGAVSPHGRRSAVALTSVITNTPPADLLTEPDQITQIEQAITLTQPEAADPLDVVRCVGSLEIAGLAGVILGAAAGRVPILLDGFVSCAAALLASELAFQVRPYLLAGHQAPDPGQQLILQRLGLRPLLHLDLAANDGSGGLLAMHLIEAAARTLTETEQTN